MIKTLQQSNTVIGNLSTEGESLRQRSIHITKSLSGCKEKSLLSRLRKERDSLEQRRNEILKIAISMKNRKKVNSLSIDLLIEICRRPIYS